MSTTWASSHAGQQCIQVQQLCVLHAKVSYATTLDGDSSACDGDSKAIHNIELTSGAAVHM